jgi:hypothetical protein
LKPVGNQPLAHKFLGQLPLWLAGFLFAGGVILCVWPDRRERKRIAKRYSEESLPGEA